MPKRRRSGLTTIEVVTILAIVAIFGIAFIWNHVRVDWVQPVARTISGARLLAVTSGAAVAVGTGICTVAKQSVGWPIVRAVVVAGLHRGLLFTPDGLPRTCDGGGVGNTTILLEHRGRQAAVIVSSLGRVRWEMR
jgi:hypothetical protein